MPPRLDVDARRAQLARAVWHVVLTQGVGAVSVRTVAHEAGVAVGSLRHVFPTRAELLEFSAELIVQRAAERVRAVPQDGDPLAHALAVLEELLPLDATRRAEMEVNLALVAEAPALPRLAAIRDEAAAGIALLCRQAVERLGGRDDESTVRRLHALLDGLALHLLSQEPGEDVTWARALLRAELERIASHHG
ncbi:TetR family transcriptional regulator C-terminal domain-containing protein [Aeromicrobium sp. IC_218]|uniref:TetR/AcrR family transcriptional regulator n=1 Tax=Aeromicrobium sp. IC_218 TaxID=2545468 RepID=UPI00103A8021|nr:TetR family transcriptional regulator C-terminal domain-containing protein [Aeromicrobium sp. IC_218]TCJ00150.1 TetR family transcriptional regulator [Aeromicrobium sp. IC_218]